MNEIIKSKINLDKSSNISGDLQREKNLMEIFNGMDMPSEVQIYDIDKSFTEFVKNDLSIIVDGDKIPCGFYTQERMAEQMKTWEYEYENGDKTSDFQIISRDTDVFSGTIYSDFSNIPGDRFYPMFRKNITVSGRSQIVEYSMKQPYGLDIEYDLKMVGTSLSSLNEFNNKIINKFKSLNAYIVVNGHYMSIELDSMSDDSEYQLDERKVYVQNARFLVKGYIINKEDFKSNFIPSNVSLSITDDSSKLVNPAISDDGGYVKLFFNVNSKNIIRFNYNKTINVSEINTENINELFINNIKYPTSGNLSINIPANSNYSIKIYRKSQTKSSSITFII